VLTTFADGLLGLPVSPPRVPGPKYMAMALHEFYEGCQDCGSPLSAHLPPSGKCLFGPGVYAQRGEDTAIDWAQLRARALELVK
jgi:hypothetical protein